MSLLQVILPVIIMLIIGIICREKKLIRPEGIEGFQALVMNFTLPISLFYTFYRASIKADTVIFPVTFFVVTAGWHFFGAADLDLGSYYDDSATAICAAAVY